MRKLHVYELMSCQDWFDGMQTVGEYLNGSPGPSEEFEDRCFRLIEMAMMAAHGAKETFWEGDIRSKDNVRVFGVPDGDGGTFLGLVWKQDNNGSSFVASPVGLPWLAEAEVKRGSKC